MQLRPAGNVLRWGLLAVSGSPNLAVTRDAFATRAPSFHALRQAVRPRGRRITLIAWEGFRMRALASARVRSGPLAWQVDGLHLPCGGAGETGAGVLDALAQRARSHGARTVYLRVPYGSPAAQLACYSGFFPCFTETLLLGGSGGGRSTGLPSRPRLPHEEYAVFQLYSGATPATVRRAVGMSFDQWRDARERSGPGVAEEVYDVDGRVRVWLGSDLAVRPVQVEVMVRPEDQDLVPRVVDHALARRCPQGWLVPEYQDDVRRLLLQRGFSEAGRYSMLVKTMVARVETTALASAEARVW